MEKEKKKASKLLTKINIGSTSQYMKAMQTSLKIADSWANSQLKIFPNCHKAKLEL